MKVSIILWDCNFRESYHTIDFFGKQNISPDSFELIWVDFYNSNDNAKKRISKYQNFNVLTLGNELSDPWHLGTCMNAGAGIASGEILILADADIAIEEDFVRFIIDEHEGRNDLVLYHKRLDETASAHSTKSTTDIDHLKSVTKLTTATNFAGCFSLLKDNFNKVNGYEEHMAYSGPGMNAMEINARFRNSGYCVKWSPDKMVFHPWHEKTTNVGEFFKNRKFLQFVRGFHHWINPYAGIEQSWIFRCRELNLDVKANIEQCNKYLASMPSINLNHFMSLYEKINNQHQ